MVIFLILFSFQVVEPNLNCKLNQYELWLKSNFRRNYKDVASQFNNAILSNARSNSMFGSKENISPLKDLIYMQVGQYYPHFYTSGQMVVQFAQIQEINRIKIWFYDQDSRIHSFKIIAICQNKIEKELFQGYQVHGLITINFENNFVSMIKIINLPGGTYGEIAIIKIQAYFVFNSNSIYHIYLDIGSLCYQLFFSFILINLTNLVCKTDNLTSCYAQPIKQKTEAILMVNKLFLKFMTRK
ncbi:unnamed protein product [Paramecium octaurelia]|uniref:Transmembrane protein n=1 Tax=Paramecium octaurelia TaxID=43137 RepID=A0A8S1UFD2_PAROT|nr:unnamed protein product [Paramecium octaurelia]